MRLNNFVNFDDLGTVNWCLLAVNKNPQRKNWQKDAIITQSARVVTRICGGRSIIIGLNHIFL